MIRKINSGCSICYSSILYCKEEAISVTVNVVVSVPGKPFFPIGLVYWKVTEGLISSFTYYLPYFLSKPSVPP